MWADVWYVTESGSPDVADGQSWDTAFGDIQAGVDAAFADGGGEVWVAEGVYTHTDDPVVTMRRDVHLYGGFAASESKHTERDWMAHAATIDGEGARRCTLGADRATLDGFRIVRGKAKIGAGMHNYEASPTVANCTFSDNATPKLYLRGGGGGMDNYRASPAVTGCTFTGNSAKSGGGIRNRYSSPTVTGCTFAANCAKDYGGAMYNEESSPVVAGCSFSQNMAGVAGSGMFNLGSSPEVSGCRFLSNFADRHGGGMWNSAGAAPKIANCVFAGNSANGLGGGMANDNASPTLVNCTFAGNTAYDAGGGICNANKAAPAIANCILWGDSPDAISNQAASPTVTHSVVGGGCPGEGNLDTDPLFANAPEGHFALRPNSPCIDAGASEGAPGTDILGTPRPQGHGVDIGACEFAPAERKPK